MCESVSVCVAAQRNVQVIGYAVHACAACRSITGNRVCALGEHAGWNRTKEQRESRWRARHGSSRLDWCECRRRRYEPSGARLGLIRAPCRDEGAALLGTNETALTSLNLSNSPIGHAGIVMLAERLAFNTTLTSLSLLHLRKVKFISGKGLDSFIAISAALIINETLQSLDLSLNSDGLDAINLLDDVLDNNHTLQSLKIGDAIPHPKQTALMKKAKKPRKKSCGISCAGDIGEWLEKWDESSKFHPSYRTAPHGSSSDDAPSAPVGTKKRKRNTEAERLAESQ